MRGTTCAMLSAVLYCLVVFAPSTQATGDCQQLVSIEEKLRLLKSELESSQRTLQTFLQTTIDSLMVALRITGTTYNVGTPNSTLVEIVTLGPINKKPKIVYNVHVAVEGNQLPEYVDYSGGSSGDGESGLFTDDEDLGASGAGGSDTEGIHKKPKIVYNVHVAAEGNQQPEYVEYSEEELSGSSGDGESGLFPDAEGIHKKPKVVYNVHVAAEGNQQPEYEEYSEEELSGSSGDGESGLFPDDEDLVGSGAEGSGSDAEGSGGQVSITIRKPFLVTQKPVITNVETTTALPVSTFVEVEDEGSGGQVSITIRKPFHVTQKPVITNVETTTALPVSTFVEVAKTTAAAAATTEPIATAVEESVSSGPGPSTGIELPEEVIEVDADGETFIETEPVDSGTDPETTLVETEPIDSGSEGGILSDYDSDYYDSDYYDNIGSGGEIPLDDLFVQPE